jgi:hypothetical protein
LCFGLLIWHSRRFERIGEFNGIESDGAHAGYSGRS